jgi:hypothetical protein
MGNAISDCDFGSCTICHKGIYYDDSLDPSEVVCLDCERRKKLKEYIPVPASEKEVSDIEKNAREDHRISQFDVLKLVARIRELESSSKSKFYQVYQCHSPSGGVGAVSEQRYPTKEEAQTEADRLLAQVGDFNLYSIDGKEYSYPAYWPQCLTERPGGILMMEFE